MKLKERKIAVLSFNVLLLCLLFLFGLESFANNIKFNIENSFKSQNFPGAKNHLSDISNTTQFNLIKLSTNSNNNQQTVSFNFTNNNSCSGEIIEFTSTVTDEDPADENSTYIYEWDFGDNVGSSADENPTYSYNTSGLGVVSFTVSLKVIDAIDLSIVGESSSSVSVISLPIIIDEPSPLTEVCLGGFVELSVTVANGVEAASYQWYSNTTNSTAGGTEIIGADQSIYTPDTSLADTKYYYVEISYSEDCDPLLSDVFTVTVVVPTVSITTVPDPQSICVGGDVSLDVISTGAGTPTYSWFYTSPGSTNITVSDVITSTTYTTPVFAQSGNYEFYVSVSYDGLECESVESLTYTVSVVDPPTLENSGNLIDSTGTTILFQQDCEGGSLEALFVDVTENSGIGNSYNYKWYSNTIDTNAGGAEIIGATNAFYTPLTTPLGVTYYYVEVYQQQSGCFVLSNTSTVLVTPENPIITDQPSPLTEVCVDGFVELSVTVDEINKEGTPIYQWFENTTNSTAGGT